MSTRRKRAFVVGCVVVALCAALAGAVQAAGPFFWYPCSPNGVQAEGQGQASTLYARDGTRIGTLGASLNRIPVAYERINPQMRKAIVAIEDRRFYENNGIDYVAIARALFHDLTGGSTQGGSTLTQQLVRNLYLGPQQTLGRKLTEACLAVQLDRKWSKDRILAAYLNEVYFGHRAYGIEAAARAFFGVHAKDLTLPQAALLAGMPQSPSGYDPFTRPGLARERRAEVLKAMLDNGDITEPQYRAALRTPLGLHSTTVVAPDSTAYLTDFISSRLVDQFGAERVRRGGLQVYTTLDAKLQREATSAIDGALNRKGDPAGTVVSIDPATGQIRAMAVAQHGRQLSFDIAADGQRQAGSTFKAFVLSEAVRRGIDPWTTKYLSAPFTGPNNWQVATYEHTYSGRISLEQATLASDNTVYARLTLDLGPQSIAALAQRMGITSPLKPVPTVGLGVNSVSPLDLADAYATLASGGVQRDPQIVQRVVFPGGQSQNATAPHAQRVLDAKAVAQVTKVLAANVRAGTGTAAALTGRPVAGKTGTTENYADAWFAGYTPQLTTVVWVGFPDKERPMGTVHGIAAVTGGTIPAQIWHTYMTQALQGEPVLQFADPGTPKWHTWCGEYQFARTAAQAKPVAGCAATTTTTTTKQQKTKTATTRTATTAPATTSRTQPATTYQTPTEPTTTSAPPPTTQATTTTPTTTAATTTAPPPTTTTTGG